MKRTLLLLASALILAAPAGAAKKAKQSTPERPSVCIWNFDHMIDVRKDLKLNKEASAYWGSYEALMKDAEKLLGQKPIAITDKADEYTAPTGDKRDFMSVGYYSWPNPNTPDGMPWIRKDGHRNPNATKFDSEARLAPTYRAMEKLGLAYFFSEDERYAELVARYADTWFVNPETRMNPNFNYAAALPGHNKGMGYSYGIIQGWHLEYCLASIGLITGTKFYTPKMDAEIKRWCSEMYTWMTTSENGIREGKTNHNHGTGYQLQLLMYASFTGDKEAIKKVDERLRQLISLQIEPDGKQPAELKRPYGFVYTNLNLRFLINSCEMIRPYDPDLFTYTTPDGRSIGKALDFATSFIGKTPEDFKPYTETFSWDANQKTVMWMARMASSLDKTGRYATIFEQHKKLVSPDAIFYLTY